MRRKEVTVLPEALKAWRTQRGWTQKDLAIRSAVSPTLIALIETNERQPSLTNALAIAKALDVPLRAFALLHVDVEAAMPAVAS